jgi:spermidine synthase
MGERFFFLSLAFLLATCSLVYELAFAKVISELTGNPTLWESLSMGSFLLGIGANAVFYRPKEGEDLWSRLIKTELLISAVAVISWYFIHFLQMNYRSYIFDGGQLQAVSIFPSVYILGILSQPLVFLLGWLSGFELVFFLNCKTPIKFRYRESVILSIYHFGALAGTLAFIASMRAALNPLTTITIFACLNMVAAGFLIFRERAWAFLPKAVGVIFFIGWSLIFSSHFEQIFLKNHYYNQLTWQSGADGLNRVSFPENPIAFAQMSGELPDIKRYRSPYQVIDFTYDISGTEQNGESEESMYINGRFQVSPRSAAEYHEFMTHVPLGLIEQQPSQVAVLGGGDGVLIHELLKHPVKEIDLIEIDPIIIEMASSYPMLTAINEKSLLDPRVRVLQQDAFRFMRKTDKMYDAIFIDLTYPFDFDSAKFYTAEFLTLTRKHLRPGGLLVAGIPMDMVQSTNPEIFSLVVNTIGAAGFSHAAAFSRESHHFLVVSLAPIKAYPEVAPDLDLDVLKPEKMRDFIVRPLKIPKDIDGEFSIQFPSMLIADDPFY